MCRGDKSDEKGGNDRNDRIGRRGRKEFMENDQLLRLSLLGPGESGKSTFLKQFNILFHEGYPELDRKKLDHVVHNNLLIGMRTLIKQAGLLNDSNPELQTALVSAETIVAKDVIDKLNYNDGIDNFSADQLRTLWNDEGIQRTYAVRHRFQMPYALDYFMNRLEDIEKVGYIPSIDDVLHMSEDDGEQKFCIIDVGGQRNERKKWIHLFDRIAAVLFVAATSEYDQYLIEDSKQNRLEESVELFDKVCSMTQFSNSALVLFLNKIDLFKDKCAKIPLEGYFPDYHPPKGGGGGDGRSVNGEELYDSGLKFMNQLFQERNKTGREVYVHLTCATDTASVRTVFEAVRDSTIDAHMKAFDSF